MQQTQEMQVHSLDREDPLEEAMATHSSLLAWKIPWTEEPRACKELDATEHPSTSSNPEATTESQKLLSKACQIHSKMYLFST